MVVKTIDVEKQYGKEVADLLNDVKKACVNTAEFGKAVDKFIEQHRGHKNFVSFVGSATIAAARKDKDSPGVMEAFFGDVPGELARNLSERNEKLREEIVKIGGKVEPSMILDKKISEFIFNDVLSKDSTKFNAAMEKIGKGGLKTRGTIEVMEELLDGYLRFSKKHTPMYEERMRTINAVLAREFQDLNYNLTCEKSRAQFRNLKAG